MRELGWWFRSFPPAGLFSFCREKGRPGITYSPNIHFSPKPLNPSPPLNRSLFTLSCHMHTGSTYGSGP